MKKIILSAAFAVMTVLGVHAGTWYYGTYGGKKDRIWFVEGDVTNWVFQTSGSGGDLEISSCLVGSGDLDFSTFTSDVGDGKKIVSIIGRTFEYYAAQPITSIVAPDLVKIGARAFYGNKNLPEVVSLPSVLKLEANAFYGCSLVKEFQFTSVTNVGETVFASCSSVTNIVLSGNLEEMGSGVIKSCSSLENLSPHYFPVLKKCGLINGTNDQNLPNFVLRMEAPELTTLVGGFLRGGTTVGLFRAPKLKAINSYSFYKVKFLQGAGDLNFPELETMDTYAFNISGVTSFRAPKLTALNGSVFLNCSSLTNVVLSQSCKSFSSGAVSGSPLLMSFEPMLPADLTKIEGGCFGGRNTLTAKNLPPDYCWPQPFVWDNAAIPNVPAELCRYFPFTNVTFQTQVDSIGAYAFCKLAARADIHFYGSVPTFGNGSLYRPNAEANNERPVIHIHTSSTLASWQEAAAPNADLFATYRETKPDCPENAIGLIKLLNESGASPIYAYLVNDAVVAGTGYLAVEGVPVELGAVDPEYGTRADIPNGTKIPCTAPNVISETDVRAGLAGYVVSNVTATGEFTFRAEGTSDNYAYEQLEDSARLIWIWTNVQYRVTAAADGPGTVSAPEQWVEYTASTTVTAEPTDGYVFRYWTGDGVKDAEKFTPTLTIPVDGPKSVTAHFTAPVTYSWSYDSGAKKISCNSSDGLETRWVFSVNESSGQLTLSSCLSGAGDLDFRSLANDIGGGKTLVGLGTALKNNSRVTRVYLPESVTSIWGDAFNGCKELLEIDAPYVQTIGLRAFQGCSKLQGTVTFPAVRNLTGGSCFYGCSSVTEFRFPSITNVCDSAFRSSGSLTNVVLSEALVSVEGNIFRDSRSILSVQPSYMPALKTISGALWWDGGSPPRNLTLDLDAPVLETVGDSAFYLSGGLAVRRFNAPKLRKLGGSAFANARFAEGAGDLDFPELEETGRSVFNNSHLTSIRAPKLTYVTNEVFRFCAKLTNAVLPSATRMHNSAFASKTATRLMLDPLLPTNMTYVTYDSFGSGRYFANTEFVWNCPQMPKVPPALMVNAELSHVVFKSDVTHVTTNAFQSLVSRAVVEFHGPTVPVLDKLPFYYNGEPGDDRIRILVRNKDAVEGWRAKVAVNDALYRAEFRRKKPDWPGRRTLGILELSGMKFDGRTTASTSYAWVVDDTAPHGLLVIVK